jgi:ABC-type phosphate transport system permease subunit
LRRAISVMLAALSSALRCSASTCAATSWWVPTASAIERLVSVTCDWMMVAPELTWTPERDSWSMTEPTASLTVQIFNYAVAPYQDWHDKAWSAALVLLLMVGTLSLAGRLLSRNRLR